MTIPLTAIISILIAHFIADFVFQSREVANNKSQDNKILTEHCIIYALVIFVITGFLNEIFQFTTDACIMLWPFVNMILHFVTDYVTSRATSAMYKEERYREFFLIIGLDQLIHYCLLFLTYVAMTKALG